MRQRFVFSEVWIGLRRNLTMTFGVLVATAVALTLLGVGLLVSAQVSVMKGYWYDKIEVTVYLCGDVVQTASCPQPGGVTDQQRHQVRQTLQDLPQVQKIYYESEDEAYHRFSDKYANTPVLVNNVRVGDLPASYRVKLTDPTQYQAIGRARAGQRGVRQVQDLHQSRDKLFDILVTVRNAAVGLAAFGLIAALLLIGNTIRLAAFSRRRETSIMRLVGASSLAIEVPFVLEGAVTGLLGGGVASAAIYGLKAVIDWKIKPIYLQFPFLGWGTVHLIVATLLATGIVLSVLASFVTIRRYLRV